MKNSLTYSFVAGVSFVAFEYSFWELHPRVHVIYAMLFAVLFFTFFVYFTAKTVKKTLEGSHEQ